jgi:hypothetical protein
VYVAAIPACQCHNHLIAMADTQNVNVPGVFSLNGLWVISLADAFSPVFKFSF